MDLVCTRCGEPWDVDYVLHEEPEGFKRKGGRIDHCPVCPKLKPEHSREEQERLLRDAGFSNVIDRSLIGEGFTLLTTQK